jgi:hypothetical protein
MNFRHFSIHREVFVQTKRPCKGIQQRHVNRDTRKTRNAMLRVAVEVFHFTNDVALLLEQISCFVSRADKNRKVQQQ